MASFVSVCGSIIGDLASRGSLVPGFPQANQGRSGLSAIQTVCRGLSAVPRDAGPKLGQDLIEGAADGAVQSHPGSVFVAAAAQPGGNGGDIHPAFAAQAQADVAVRASSRRNTAASTPAMQMA